MRVALWIWIGAAGASVLGLAVWAIVGRSSLRLAARVARACATDARLPAWLRWVAGVGLAAKALPVDFGIDELAGAIVAVALVTRYRPALAAIVREQRQREIPAEPAPSATVPQPGPTQPGAPAASAAMPGSTPHRGPRAGGPSPCG